MGNRAHVIFTEPNGSNPSPAVYLHWNGGPESVYAFLDELEARGVRNDSCYAPARFCQVVGEFFDSNYREGLSLGVVNGPHRIEPHHLGPFDHGDNGIYVVAWIQHEDEWIRSVRRFTTPHDAHLPKEWSEKAVEQERRAAYRHDYMTADEGSLPAFFARIRGPVGYQESKRLAGLYAFGDA